jgi:hypothetical protein
MPQAYTKTRARAHAIDLCAHANTCQQHTQHVHCDVCALPGYCNSRYGNLSAAPRARTHAHPATTQARFLKAANQKRMRRSSSRVDNECGTAVSTRQQYIIYSHPGYSSPTENMIDNYVCAQRNTRRRQTGDAYEINMPSVYPVSDYPFKKVCLLFGSAQRADVSTRKTIKRPRLGPKIPIDLIGHAVCGSAFNDGAQQKRIKTGTICAKTHTHTHTLGLVWTQLANLHT